MKYAVVYSSRTGNTKILAEKIKSVLGTGNCVYFGEASNDVPEADVVFAGFWTDKGICSEEMAEFIESLEETELFLFGTAGFGGEPDYFAQILKRVEVFVQDSCTVKGTFMCQGKMPASVRQRYKSLQSAGADEERIQAMLENFDRAQTHPDESDLKNLEEELKKIWTK